MSAPPPQRSSYLLDTHIWLWYVLGVKRLTRGLRAALDAAGDALWLSPISIWELGLLHQRGRVQLSGGMRSWVRAALTQTPLRQAPVTAEIALVSRELAFSHRDPADQLIAATAVVHGLTLMTVDERLREVPGLSVIWT